MSDTTKLEIELPEPYDRIATLISDDADAGLIEIPVFTAEQVRAAIEADRNKRAVAPDTPQEWKEAGALPPSAAKLTMIREAVKTYYAALDNRQHGGIAQDRAFKTIEQILGMYWVQGASKVAAQGGRKT